MRIAVVGAGIAGLCLAWALIRRGQSVTIFDQGPIPNPVSSSFDEHRITRHSYFGLEGYGALMTEAFALYELLWRDLGARHFHDLPMVYLSRTGVGVAKEATEALDALGIGWRALEHAELEKRLPMVDTDGVERALLVEGAGMLFAGRIVTDLARWLAGNGARLRPGTRVRAIGRDAATVTTEAGIETFDAVIVAAGAWVGDLLPETAATLVPSRQLVLYLDPPAHWTQAWAQAPIIVDAGAHYGSYILPPREDTRLKIGDHVFTRRGHGGDDRIARPEDIAPVRAAFVSGFRDAAAYRVLEEKVCYYTVAADERFVVRPVSNHVWLMSACSGHGFKLAPLIATGLADAVLGRRPAPDITRWAAGLAS